MIRSILNNLFFCFVLLATAGSSALAQNRIERKVVIEGGKYYYFTVNDDTQLASIIFGNVGQKMSAATKRNFPIGRETTEPQNPLSFDISKETVVGVNWILNSNNSRDEAIKSIPLKEWKKVRNLSLEQWIQVSIEQSQLASNEPWQKMLEHNNVLNHTYFDLIQQSKQLIMAVCNQNQLRISTLENGVWKHSPLIKVDFQNYFSLVHNGKNLGIIDASGNVYRYDDKSVTLTKVSQNNNDKAQILIIDKDHQKIYRIKNEALFATPQQTLTHLIHQIATEINF